MGYPPQPQDPYGQQQPQQPYGYSGPQPTHGYGYQPPTSPPAPEPPRRSNVGLIVLLAAGLPLLMLGGCAAVLLVVADSGKDAVVSGPDSPNMVMPSQQPASSAPPAAERTTEPGSGSHTVVLEAVGKDGATSANNVTYSVKFDIKQEQGVPLPYSKEISAANPFPASLWVQNAGAEGVVECRIKVDGRVIREAASTGPYGVCNVRADAP